MNRLPCLESRGGIDERECRARNYGDTARQVAEREGS